MQKVLQIIEELLADGKKKFVSFEEIVKKAEEEKIDKKRVREYLDKLSKTGDIYEPRPYKYALTNR